MSVTAPLVSPLASPLEPPPRVFESSEYRARLDRAQSLMTEARLAAILLTTEHDIHYFTGFFTPFWQSPTRPWYVVLPAVGQPIAVIPAIGVQCMGKGWVEDIRSWPSPHPMDEGVSLLVEALVEARSRVRHLGRGQDGIGINRGRETHVRMPLDDYERLCAAMEKHRAAFRFGDATAILRGLRMIKSPAEIARVRYVAQLVSGVYEQLFEFVEIGMGDDEIFRAFKRRCLEAGVDDVAYLVGAAGNQGYDDIISPPAGRVLRRDDILILDTGCAFAGYFCDFDRNYGFGKIDDVAKRAYNTVWQATEAGLEAARPGNACKDLFHAMDAVMKKNGAPGETGGETVGRYGHGLGLQLTEPPSNTSWDDTRLEVGMVLTLEPGMVYAPNKMMVHEENIAITESGASLLSRRAPLDLPISG